MPDYLRALVVILVLAIVVFSFVKKHVSPFLEIRDFNRWRNTWLILTTLAFLFHNIWIYFLVAGLMLANATKREDSPVGLFYFLLFLMPAAPAYIPGFGLINYFFTMTHLRLLSLVILLPTYLHIRRNGVPFGRSATDKLLLAYILLLVVIEFRSTPSITGVFRETLSLYLDIFLPYYVISRALTDIKQFRTALFGFVLAAMLLAIIGVFESVRHWMLYTSLLKAMQLHFNLGGFSQRAGLIRAAVTTGNAIALGYAMMVAIGFYLYLASQISSKNKRLLGGLLLLAGLLASLSRGPWVGAAVILLVFSMIGPAAMKKVTKMALGSVLAIAILAALPGGQKFVDLLPVIGKSEQGTIDYRSELIDKAIIVIKRNPFFGSDNYFATDELESMRQGQGIIDVTNTYIQVALRTGLVGLGLFSGIFLTVMYGIYKALKSIKEKSSEEYRLGQALQATLVGILLTILTVSSITIIPVVYWSVAGLGVAYCEMVRRSRNIQPLRT